MFPTFIYPEMLSRFWVSHPGARHSYLFIYWTFLRVIFHGRKHQEGSGMNGSKAREMRQRLNFIQINESVSVVGDFAAEEKRFCVRRRNPRKTWEIIKEPFLNNRKSELLRAANSAGNYSTISTCHAVALQFPCCSSLPVEYLFTGMKFVQQFPFRGVALNILQKNETNT